MGGYLLFIITVITILLIMISLPNTLRQVLGILFLSRRNDKGKYGHGETF